MWIKVIVLGIVEGLTEFLPISSTGHLIVASRLLNYNAIGGVFEIFIQLGAVVAVLIFYWSQLWSQLRSVRRDAHIQRFWLGIIVAFIPAPAIGFLFADVIDAVLFNPTVVAIALIAGGIVFLFVERPGVIPAPTATEVTHITLRQALAIGIAQTLALIPGVSRSGASIVSGMLVGLDRSTATQFSFYLSIPTLGIATIYTLVRNLDSIQPDQMAQLLVGAVVAGIVAWLSIKWLLGYVAHNNFRMFGYYRIIAGIIILLLVAFAGLSVVPGA
ncbi:MAG: undecaprenyl-diphosphate phosphatase [Anaerolineae bacterium]|nr:undecaprenyl-diphosphate phosphatase [Anaerolineae bacterium]